MGKAAGDLSAAAGGVAGGLIGISVAMLVVSIIQGLATLRPVLLAISRGGRHRRPSAAAAGAVAKASAPETGVPVGAKLPTPPEGRAPAWADQPAGPVIANRRATVVAGRGTGGYADPAQQAAGLAALLAIATTIGPPPLRREPGQNGTGPPQPVRAGRPRISGTQPFNNQTYQYALGRDPIQVAPDTQR